MLNDAIKNVVEIQLSGYDIAVRKSSIEVSSKDELISGYYLKRVIKFCEKYGLEFGIMRGVICIYHK